MVGQMFIYLSRAVCLMLVLATGMTGIAFANHDGSHGSHCVDSSQEKPPASHDHSAGQQQAAADPETKERSCVQHSCVAVVASLSIEAHVQRLVSDMPALRGHLFHASLSAESLHRPPIA